jgi:transposase-like protein
VAAFCRKEGVSKATFYAWRRRLGDGGGDEPAVEFVEVTPTATRGAASIEIEIDGVVVRVGPAFDADDLRRVLGVLQGRGR